MKKSIFALLFTLIFVSSTAGCSQTVKEIPGFDNSNNSNNSQNSQNSQKGDVNVGTLAEVGAVNGKIVKPEIFGVNMLFFTENDTVRASDKYQASMKYLGPKLMRYPGGTAGDNYMWKKKDIYTSEWYPEKGDSVNDMDTDEFLDFAKKYGAEPLMVINYRSYIKMGDMEAGYKDAEDWVKYVNIEKKAGAKYWEYGNELFYKENSEVRCQFTPEQYGEHYLELRKRLKVIDPGIKLGLVLHNRWGSGGPNVVNDWNERVMKTIKCDADFVILHFYPGMDAGGFAKDGMNISKGVQEVRNGIKSIGGSTDIPVLITEWNNSAKSDNIKGQTIGHVTGVAQGFLEIIDSGIERAMIWPMMNSGTRMLNSETYAVEPAGEMFHWMNGMLAGSEAASINLTSKSSGTEIKAFVSPDKKWMRVVAVNRNIDREETASVSLKDYSIKGDGKLKTVMSDKVKKGEKLDMNDKKIITEEQIIKYNSHMEIKLPPMSVSVLEIPIGK